MNAVLEVNAAYERGLTALKRVNREHLSPCDGTGRDRDRTLHTSYSRKISDLWARPFTLLEERKKEGEDERGREQIREH